MEDSLAAIQAALAGMAREQEAMQRGLRQLRGDVASAATTLSAPRVRELYLRLLQLYDLVEPPPAHLGEEGSNVCRLLATQIEQYLAVNGFLRIEADGAPFDARQHKPVGQDATDDPARENWVKATRRHGFCSDQGVLRPAEIVLWRLEKAGGNAECRMPNAESMPNAGPVPKTEGDGPSPGPTTDPNGQQAAELATPERRPS